MLHYTLYSGKSTLNTNVLLFFQCLSTQCLGTAAVSRSGCCIPAVRTDYSMRWSETTSWRSPKRCREACYTVLLHNTAKHVIEIISTNITLFTNVNYMCVCVCACMCVCVCVLARVRAHVCACTYVRTCMIIIVCVCVHGCSCVCGMHGCVCMCACVCVDGDRQRGRPDRRLPVRGGAPHGAHPEAGLLQTQRTGREARQQEAHQGGRREWGRQLDMHTSIYCT